MDLANGQFTKVGCYSTIFRSHANFVFPDPDAGLGRLLDPELNALVHHCTRSLHSDATVEKGEIRGEEAFVGGGDAAISKPPASPFGTARVIGLVRSAD
jgi:hypothetical protein